ncbi:hypothetical protein NE237_011159 [Protea cynaroides]|uniref:Lysine ketoglutarate reductase trans-splicing-like protein n=1 Tax=Protea cynaroides TaxID=273540 RepID=A0A9Q0JWI1_9MAGN|nr:hypothetical protein NE237_011159 [Protea cynaroides]
MKTSKRLSLSADPKTRRSCLCTLLPTASLVCVIFFMGSMFVATDYKERSTKKGMADTMLITETVTCENHCRPEGSEALPKGIVSRTSDLKMQPLWGSPKERKQKHSVNLLAMAVGIRQKENVSRIVKKFPSNDFIVMLFHYDGMVNEWNDQEWSHHAIHVSAISQTKWWFAKRFLHPDIVAEYDYIFLWDEDLGVEHFNPGRYLSIVKEEGLEISQPALDVAKSEVHHQITARARRSKVHRRTYKVGGGRRCDVNSTSPPCTGWIEMMAPVFSRASWRCTWYMIQNDLIHAWGLDFQLGYCAQGDRTKNVGVVDAEYIVHQGLPTLGGLEENNISDDTPGQASVNKHLPDIEVQAPSQSHANNDRYAVRKRSFVELEMFKNRWKKSVRDDKCWSDPFQQPAKQ